MEYIKIDIKKLITECINNICRKYLLIFKVHGFYGKLTFRLLDAYDICISFDEIIENKNCTTTELDIYINRNSKDDETNTEVCSDDNLKTVSSLTNNNSEKFNRNDLIYNREFLLALKYKKASFIKPDCLPDLDCVLHHPLFKSKHDNNVDAVPRFDIHLTDLVGHTSWQRDTTSHTRIIPNSLDTKIQFNRSEIPWKSVNASASTITADVKLIDDTNEFMCQFRGNINTLTEQRYQTLLTKFKDMNIDTLGKMNAAVELVFEKGLNEPFFSALYAKLANDLSYVELKVVTCTDTVEVYTFKELLIKRCDELFNEAHVKNTNVTGEKERRQATGHIKFIGELFKLGMINGRYISNCIETLLNLGVRDSSLECLCILLSIVGKHFEKPQLNGYLRELNNLGSNKKVSSRLKFLIQDVLDLQENKWVPRHVNSKLLTPTTTIDYMMEGDSITQKDIQHKLVNGYEILRKICHFLFSESEYFVKIGIYFPIFYKINRLLILRKI